MDFLAYRLPDSNEIVQQKGQFKALLNQHEPLGFVVSDFLHQQLYVFEEQNFSDEVVTFHEGKVQPIVISKRDYQIEAQAMLHAFPLFAVEKAVYSRVKRVSFSIKKALELFQKLAEAYPSAFVYLISSENFGTWIGASPEVLLSTNGMALDTVALAGTMKTGEQRDWLKKEQEEHAFVTEHVVATLKRNDVVAITLDGPKNAVSGPVTHLKTWIQGELTSSNAWQIAMDLHPTPAVCGTPRMAALDLISSREMHDRSLYTGVIGLTDSNKKQLFVNLRCAQLFSETAYLYVGGGYTVDSIPDLEWEETENKALTLEKIMKTIG